MMIIIMTIIINLFNTKLLQNDRFNIMDSAPRRTWKGDRVLRSHFEKSHFKDFRFEVELLICIVDVFIVSWFCVTLFDEQCMKWTCSLTSTIGARTRFLRGAVGRKPNFSEVSDQVLRSTPRSSQKYRTKFSEVSDQVLRSIRPSSQNLRTIL